MAQRPPPVPPAGRSNKGPDGRQDKAGDKDAASREARNRKRPDDPDEPDRTDDAETDNVRQNTTNHGRKQAR